MLMKLCKHEWKYFWKVPATINLCLIILSLLGIGFLASPLLTLDYDWIEVLIFFGVMIYYLAIIAGSLGISVYTAIRYYKNVYTDEGYLTNTLPVTPRQIILSKLSVSAIWNFITSIVITISIFMLVAFAASTYGDTNLWHELALIWDEFIELTGGGLDYILFILSIIINLLISPFFSIVMLYSSIALGQLFKKHKVAGAVIWYIAEYMIVQFITSVIMNVPLFSGLIAVEDSDLSMMSVINPIMYGTILLTVVATGILYFITEYMLKKKLNLE